MWILVAALAGGALTAVIEHLAREYRHRLPGRQTGAQRRSEAHPAQPVADLVRQKENRA